MGDTNLIWGTLLRLLADDNRHTMESLASAVGLSVAQLRSHLEELNQCGVELQYGVATDTVVWHNPAELLSAADIRSRLDAYSNQRVRELSIDTVCASTNERVCDAGIPAPGDFHVALTEYQKAGRGRRGRTWCSPMAGGICLTAAVRYPAERSIDSALTLALGIAVSQALTPLLDTDVWLKWPNDLLIEGGKLGGILTELQAGDAVSPVVLIGIGINVKLPAGYSLELQPAALTPAALANYLRADLPRSALIARILDRLVADVEAYWTRGFSPLIDQWAERDFLRNRTVKVMTGAETVRGVAEGVNEEGALVLNVDGARHYLHSGEVSVRFD